MTWHIAEARRCDSPTPSIAYLSAGASMNPLPMIHELPPRG